jgi:hypothetical protein
MSCDAGYQSINRAVNRIRVWWKYPMRTGQKPFARENDEGQVSFRSQEDIPKQETEKRKDQAL